MKLYKIQILPKLVLAIILFLGIFSVLVPQQAAAASALCAPALSSGSATTCDPSVHKPFFGVTYQDGHCYRPTAQSGGFQWVEDDCSKQVYQTAGGQQVTNARCQDGTTQSGVGASSDQLCASHGGLVVTPVSGSLCDPITGQLKETAKTDPRSKQVICAPGTCVTKDTAGQCVDCNIKDQTSSCSLFHYISLAINFMAVLLGIAVTGLIIAGGIQYSAAGSNPGAVEKAKKRIGSGIGALVGFGLLYAIVQWLIPGGIFR